MGQELLRFHALSVKFKCIYCIVASSRPGYYSSLDPFFQRSYIRLQTIQIELILLCVWAEPAILGSHFLHRPNSDSTLWLFASQYWYHNHQIPRYNRRLELVIDKTPVKRVKQIAIAVSRFFKVRHLYSREQSHRNWSLLAISAHRGDLGLLQFN